MKVVKIPLIAVFFFLFSCGIQEYYYLPQVPESNITSSLTDSATIRIPSISQYYYATNYSIFYRIYISGENFSSVQENNMNSLNPDLARDYNSFKPYTDSSGTAITTQNIFVNLKYFEIALDDEDIEDIFTVNGGTINIQFPITPGSYPTVSLDNGNEIRLRRAADLGAPEPRDDLSFRNTPELNDNTNATTEKNADVALYTGSGQRYAYASMYIVARGYNNELFSLIYSKPTHINVFRLPDIN